MTPSEALKDTADHDLKNHDQLWRILDISGQDLFESIFYDLIGQPDRKDSKRNPV